VYSIGIITLLILSSLFTYLGLDMAASAEGGELLDPVVTITDPTEDDKFGWNVSWIGDVNGDGYDDVIVGAPYTDVYPGMNSWWNNNWLHRIKLTFNNSGQSDDLMNFPVLVNLSAMNFNYSKAKLDGTDLRFIDGNGVTELNYHIEDWDSSGYSYVWIDVTNIEGGSSSDYIWMYYGNPVASNTQNIEGTYDGNFSAVWHLNETTGTHFDATSNDNDGTQQNGVTQDFSGKIDGADYFDGTNREYISVSDSSSLDPANDMTVEAWVKFDDLSSTTGYNQVFLYKIDTDPPYMDYELMLGTDDYFYFGFFNLSGTSYWSWYTGSVSVDTWYYIVGMRDGSNMRFYVNGESTDCGGDSDASGTLNDGDGALRIGTEWGKYHLNGSMDEVRFSDSTRSPDWISAQYLSMSNNFITYGSEEVKGWSNSTWSNRMKLTFDNSGQSEDLEYFPLLVKLNSTNFDYVKAKADGTDLRFIDVNNVDDLNYHIEEWNPLGDSFVWVNVTNIEGSSSNDFIWMYYNNPAAFDVQDPSMTYYSNYIGVWHLNETSGTLYDSTSNNNHGTPYNGLLQGLSGNIDGSIAFDGTDDYVDINPFTLDDYTIDFWFTGEGTIIGYENVTMRTSVDLGIESADMTIYGERGEDQSGCDVSSGDINGDGVNDTVVGSIGSVFITYGDISRPDPDTIDLNSQPANLTIRGEAHARFGTQVTTGDVNNDGFDDMIIGSTLEDSLGRSDSGAAYVIYGYGYAPGTTIDLTVASANITIYGEKNGDNLGRSVATGDINNDGIDDVIVGANAAKPGGRSGAGSIYVLYGDNYPSSMILDLNSQPANLTIHGNEFGDSAGMDVASGDFNNDGFDDIIIGASGADPAGGNNAGEAYVIYGLDYASGTVIDLNSSSANLTIYGNNEDDNLGRVLAAGDINNDGFDDVICGVYWADSTGGTRAGAVCVIYGADYASGTELDLNSTSANLTIFGDDASDYLGYSVSSGDINSDGFSDVIAGAYGTAPPGGNDAGTTYVIYGADYASGTLIDLNLTSANLTIHGDDMSDLSGISVSSGDMNDDGITDVIIGASAADPPGGTLAGETYVVYGSDYLSGTVIDLDKGPANITIMGDNGTDKFGRAIASGDVNADGYYDLIIGGYTAVAPGGIDAGKTFVFFGKSDFTPTIDLALDSADITIYGDNSGDYSGYAVSSADVNYDGFDDIIIGAYGADAPGGISAGMVYVIYGGNFVSDTIIDLDITPADITIYGDDVGDNFGRAVSSGDINNDGFFDVIVGATWADLPTGSNEGAAYVIFGKDYVPGTIIDLNLVSANLTIYGENATDYCGLALSSGDVNNDGFDDVIIGAYGADPGGGDGAGETYVFYGADFAAGSVIDLSLESANLTVYGNGTDTYSGYSVASGDINNDGYSDVIIGAYQADPGGRNEAGETYVIYGGNYVSGSSIDLSYESANITILGDDANDRFGRSVFSGDVNNDGISDLIIGAYLAEASGGNQKGEAYVIYGFDYASGTVIDLSVQSANLTIFGIDTIDRLGSAVYARDINNDGFAEIIAGAFEADFKSRYNSGEVYIINPILSAEIIKVETVDFKLRTVFAATRNTSSVTSSDINTSIWHHVTVTKDNVLRLYVDGILMGTANVDFGSIDAGLNFTLGALNRKGSLLNYFRGFIDELRISKTAKSADWIYAQYLSMSDGFITFGSEQMIYSEAEMKNDAGAAYIFFGYPGISASQLDVSNADVTIYGSNSGDLLGWSVSDAGDVNNDGYDDLIIGAPHYDAVNLEWGPQDMKINQNLDSMSQIYPDVAVDLNGNVVVAWRDDRNGSLNDDIFAQKFDSEGNALWGLSDVRVNQNITDAHYNPSVAVDSDGNAIIVWYDRRDGYYEVYAQKLNSTGVSQWGSNDLRVSQNLSSVLRDNCDVAVDSDGNSIIIWRDARNGDSDIYAQKLDPNGIAQWGSEDVKVNQNSDTKIQIYPAVILDTDGNTIVVWQDYRNNNPDIYAQKLNLTGDVLWGPFDKKVNQYLDSTKQEYPDVDLDQNGNAVVVWMDERNGTSNYDIYAQKLDSNGDPKWGSSDIKVNQNTRSAQQYYPAVGVDSNGNAVVVWRDKRNSALGDDIYAQRLNSSGAAQLGSSDLKINQNQDTDDQYQTVVAIDQNGNAIIIWNDNRNGTFDNDIYAQKLNISLDTGRAYIFYGRQLWNAGYDASSANVMITGEYSGDNLGFSVSGAQDVNGMGSDNFYEGWKYRKKITIKASQVVDDLIDFPVLINVTDSDLRSKARSDGYDIFFTELDGITKLDHEVERYNGGSGELISWVRIPNLSSSSDTSIFMHYGNNGQATSMENPADVWDSNYSAVWHLNDDFLDSTNNNHHGTNFGSDDNISLISHGQDFENDDSTDKIDVGNWNIEGQGFTIQAWINFESFASDGRIISKADGVSESDHTWMLSERNNTIRLRVTTSSTVTLEATGGGLSTTPWYFAVGTYDGANMRLRIDKTEVGSVAQTGDIMQDTRGIAIGNQPEGTLNPFDGIIDEMRVSSIRRSNAWLDTEYNNIKNTSSFYTISTEEINNISWMYRRPITISASEVMGDLVDFPVLIDITHPDLKDKARADGYDILFTDSDGWTKLDHEIELYNGTIGNLIAWVKVPLLSSTSDTEIYMYYGNSEQSTPTENPAGVWDDDYVMVQHLRETSGTHYDSTQYGFDGTEYIDSPGTQNAIGKIDGADEFDGSDDYVKINNIGTLLDNERNITFSLWVNTASDGTTWDNPFSFGNGQFRFESGDPTTNIHVFNSGIDNDEIIEALGSITLDAWNFITFASNDSSWALYIDGTIRDSGTTDGGLNVGSDLFLGARFEISDQWKGLIDEVRISNATRSIDWITTEFNNQNDTSSFYSLGSEELTNNSDDVIIGAYGFNGNRGRAYIFYGGSEFRGEISAGNADVIINGSSPNVLLGWDVSSAGDVNDDGVGDVIIGAPGNNSNTGAAYIFYGNDSMSSPIDASNADVVLLGESPGDEFGYSVSEAEDLNEDGYDDVIVGAPEYADLNGTYSFDWGASDTLVQQSNSTGWHYPEVAVDPSGNVVFVWHGSTGGPRDIYVMKLDPEGNPLWGSSDIMVNQYSAATQEYPAVAIDSDGYMFIVWQDNRDTNHDIFVQRLSPNGTVLWPSDVMVHQSSPNREQYDPDVAVDSNGNAIIVWRDYRSSDCEIYAQKLDANGNALWDSSDVQVNQETNDYQTYPKVVMDSNDNAIIVWEDDRTDTDIYAQKLNSSGVAKWGPSDKPVNQNSTGLQKEPDLAVDSNGNAIVVWEDNRNGNGDIYTQKLDSDGNPQWGSDDKKVNQNSDSASQYSPDVALNSADSAIVVWYDSRDNPTLDLEIYSQKLNSSGGAQWGSSDKKINQNPDSAEQNKPAVAVDYTGNIYITWYDNRSGPLRVYAQKLSPPCSGRAYIYHGGSSMDSTADVILEGENDYDRFGFSVNRAGDLNGDAVADVIVGAPYYDNGAISDAGAIYVFKGGASMDNLADWKYYGEQLNDHFGWSVSYAGDLNGDGQYDIIVGAPDNDDGGFNAGKVYILTISSIKVFVTDIIATPSIQFVDDYVNITCDVTALNGIEGVWLNVTYPGGGYTKVPMIQGIGNQWYNDTIYAIPGLYQYTIRANDILGNWTISDTFQFEILNRLPTLTFPQVDPVSGNSATPFNFTVIYTDLDNQAPYNITVNISGVGVYDLLELDPLDLDYTDGKEFYYNKSGFTAGSYPFHFAANDTIGDWVESGILQFDVLGNGPMLSLGQVDPALGYLDTWFNFTVRYAHGDNIAPSNISANITTRGVFTLNEVDPLDLNYSDGKEYYRNITGFNIGQYSFHFAANDTNGIWNESSITTFDVLNRIPILSLGQVNPSTGYTDTGFNFTVSYTDLDDHAPGVITINISGYGVFDLLEVNPLDTGYKDGKDYYFNTSGFAVGSYNFHFAANDTIEDWVEGITLQFDVVNRNPVLSNIDVTPTTGFMDTLFNFTVIYTDPDNHAPNAIAVNISGVGSFALFEVDPLDMDYADGKEYYYTLSGFALGSYSFKFTASDILGYWTESEFIMFDVVNRAPVLSSGLVNPNPGYVDTLFNFTVTYTDLDNHAPDKITVNITGIGVYSLEETDALDADYTDGKEYYYTLSGFSVGSYTYHFAANDTIGNWFVTTISGFDVVNRNPTLSNENVDPQTGYIDTWFNFTVTYTDLDDHAPNFVSVNITGLGSYDLQETNSLDMDFSDGKDYYCNLFGFTLNSYAFHFAANDTIGNWTETNVQQFDVVNRAPILSFAQVNPNPGYVDTGFNFTVTYMDLDNHIPDYITVNITGMGIYDLVEIESSDLDYSDGKEYYLNISGFGIGQYPFHFAASDLIGEWTESGILQLDVVNRAPILSLEQVDPISGSIDTHFNFTVSYTDLDNHAPNIITLNITVLGDFVMMETNPFDNDYSNGKEYYYNMTLSSGSYIFHFAANDSMGQWAIETTPINAPYVSPKPATIFPIDSVSEFSDPIQLNARLLDDEYNPIQDENVAFYIDINNNGIYEIGEFVEEGVTLSDGSISVTYTSYITVDTYNFTAIYNGSEDYTVEDGVAQLTINPKAATLTAIIDVVEVGETATLTATLIDSDYNLIENEEVEFYLDKNRDGVYPRSEMIVLTTTSAQGVASINYYVNLTPENYGIWAKYVGSANYVVNELQGLITVQDTSNSPPMILWTVPNQIKPEDNPPWTLDLTSYEADVEDSGTDLKWYLTGVDTSLYSVTGMNSSADVLTFIPVPNAYGSDEVKLWLVDTSGDKDSQVLWINITSVNDLPYFDPLPPSLQVHYDDPSSNDDDPTPWDYTFYVHDIETPIENLILTSSEPTVDLGQGYAKVDGLKVTYYYPQSRVGKSIYVTLKLSDGTDTTQTLIKVTVTSNWVPELIAELPNIVLEENTTLFSIFDLDDYFSDRDNDSLFFSSGYFNIEVQINENNTVDITALGHWTGTEYVTFRARDPSGAISEDTVTVTVIPVNDGPSISHVPDLVVHFDDAYAFDLSPYISDPDNLPSELTVWTSEITGYIGIQQHNNLGLVVTYPEELNGSAFSVIIYVSDGLQTASQEINITVTDNFPPELAYNLPDVFFDEDTSLIGAFTLSDYFFDVDSSVLFYTNGSKFVNVTINEDQTVDFTAPVNWFGSEIITFRATDPIGALAEDKILVVVVPVNDAPTIKYMPRQEKREGDEWILDLSQYIDDIDNDISELIISLESEVGEGYVTLVGNILVFKYPEGINSDTITISVSDGDLETSRSFIVSIESIESPPPTFWDIIPWPWLITILLVEIGIGIVIYKRKSAYQVYEAFLIHEKGLPMAHVSEKESSDLEDVVVSGMFTAVQDFINDAFTSDGSDDEWELDEMKFGDHKILIERSAELYLAVIFEGNGNKLRLRVKKLLIEINHAFGEELEGWDGNMRILKGIRAMTFTLFDSKRPKRLGRKYRHFDDKKEKSELALSGKDDLKGVGLEELHEFIDGVEGSMPIGFGSKELEVYDCPVCGKEVTTKDSKCIRCGADHQELRKQKEGIKVQMMECPACGMGVREDATFCQNCRVEFIEDEELEVLECPMCGVNIDPSATSCYNCGVRFLIERKIDGGFDL
jgi:hypothetical protein